MHALDDLRDGAGDLADRGRGLVLDALRDLNPDELSPREALDRLYQLNRLARQ